MHTFSSYEKVSKIQFASEISECSIFGELKPVNTLITVKDAIGVCSDIIGAQKIAVQVFLLEKQTKMPTTLLVERDVFTVLLQYLTNHVIRSAKTRGVTILLSWSPPAGWV